MMAALSITLYKSTLPDLKDIMDYVFSNKKCKGLLITTYQDHAAMVKAYIPENNTKEERCMITTDLSSHFKKEDVVWSGESNVSENVTNSDIQEIMKRVYGLTPDLYLDANINPNKKKWLLYTPFVINMPGGTYKILPPSKRFRKFIQRMITNKGKKGSHVIFFKLPSVLAFIACLISGFVSGNLGYFLKTIRFLLYSFIPGSKILLKDLVCQEGPTVNDQG